MDPAPTICHACRAAFSQTMGESFSTALVYTCVKSHIESSNCPMCIQIRLFLGQGELQPSKRGKTSIFRHSKAVEHDPDRVDVFFYYEERSFHDTLQKVARAYGSKESAEWMSSLPGHLLLARWAKLHIYLSHDQQNHFDLVADRGMNRV
jgi:hypothetical protein